MLIESSTPLTIRRRSGEVHLLPRQPVDFPEDEALKPEAKAPGKVREVMTDWLAAWRESGHPHRRPHQGDPGSPWSWLPSASGTMLYRGNWVRFAKKLREYGAWKRKEPWQNPEKESRINQTTRGATTGSGTTG